MEFRLQKTDDNVRMMEARIETINKYIKRATCDDGSAVKAMKGILLKCLFKFKLLLSLSLTSHACTMYINF